MEVLRSIWLFIQDQVLGMKWLNAVIGNGLSAVGLDTSTRWGGSIQFFLYDVISCNDFLCGIGGQGVGSRKIHDVNPFVLFVGSLFLVYGYSRPVSYPLPGTGQVVE